LHYYSSDALSKKKRKEEKNRKDAKEKFRHTLQQLHRLRKVVEKKPICQQK
jgi:hypothetical protein